MANMRAAQAAAEAQREQDAPPPAETDLVDPGAISAQPEVSTPSQEVADSTPEVEADADSSESVQAFDEAETPAEFGEGVEAGQTTSFVPSGTSEQVISPRSAESEAPSETITPIGAMQDDPPAELVYDDTSPEEESSSIPPPPATPAVNVKISARPKPQPMFQSEPKSSRPAPRQPDAEVDDWLGQVERSTLLDEGVDVERVGAGETTPFERSRLDRSLVVAHQKNSPVSEQFRSLRARLLNMNPDRKRQLITITSSLPREGKSTTTLNLGLSMAENPELEIVVIDADLRRGAIGPMLGISSRPGLADWLRGAATLGEALRTTHLPNLKVIPAGGCAEVDPSSLLTTNATRHALQKLRDRFDYVLLDTPPVNSVSDVSVLAPHCDGSILVVEMGRTPESAVQEAVRTLHTNNVLVMGCVLTRVEREQEA